MDPQRQRQFINQMLQSNAKTEEELKEMTVEERREYLQGRLKQRMFVSTTQRQSSQQKKVLQERMQTKLEEANKGGEVVGDGEELSEKEVRGKNYEKNRRKREKEKMKKMQREALEEVDGQREVESDYESD